MKNLNVWVGIFLLLFAGLIFYFALSYDYYSNIGPGPGLFPIWLSGLLLILSIMYIVSAFKKDEIRFSDVFPKGAQRNKILRILGSILLFILISPYAGFTLSGTVVLCILFIGEMKWYTAVGTSVITTVVVFLIFNTFLGVPLPMNAFGW
ncbi:tripartite tricarboxylate transporter TctB family protein [Fictibacillus enclensis]|uniref:tripartite tricarboxylate transporter TctB family protein n=1 Tax=Fictibacillus enclensis TaxID=1017270 RepID=UPI0025A08C13|nr:tripartite tricarboxylate transporter TctB family protein [Fictibacillus enclensis]MDM5340442.1 tripartite tricarboxylate transporter TctB family protein [Fictibacillus enclensis]